MAFMLGKQPFAARPNMLAFTTVLEHLAAVQGLPAPPNEVDWTKTIPANGWGPLANDTIGDCTVAAADHMLMCWSDNAHHAPWAIDPTDATNDFNNYRTAVDSSATWNILDGWQTGGFSRRDGGAPTPVRIDHFALLNINDNAALPTQVRQSIQLLGGCYIGFILPVFATETVGGKVQGKAPEWNKTSAELNALGAQAAKAQGGGHCVNAIGYTQTGLTVVTWGQTTTMSWDFFLRYMDEAWAILCTQAWLGDNGLTPSGLTAAQLNQDFMVLQQAGRGR